MFGASKCFRSKKSPFHLLIGLFLILFSSVFWAETPSLQSPDGTYKANLVYPEDGSVHYKVVEVRTGRKVLTTRAQYPTTNDVKAGMFSPDSRQFAAAYHYGHEGAYTWIGIWSLETGNLIKTERKSGWRRDISWVFKKKKE